MSVATASKLTHTHTWPTCIITLNPPIWAPATTWRWLGCMTTTTQSSQAGDCSPMFGHMVARWVSALQEVASRIWWIACPEVCLSLTSVHMLTPALKCLWWLWDTYVCSQRGPVKNEPAELSSHRSQTVLIHHNSALIGWISTSLPVRQAGGEMSWDKQLNSQIQSGEGERQRGGKGRAGVRGKDKDTEGWKRWRNTKMQMIYLENSSIFLLFVSRENN